MTCLALLVGPWGGRGRELAAVFPGAAGPAPDSATFAERAVTELAALRAARAARVLLSAAAAPDARAAG
ncbi:MAG: hypothetical protein ACREMJ_04370 [Gemmatimonadales bacterium]